MKSLPHAEPCVPRLRSANHVTEGMSSVSLFEKGFFRPHHSYYFPSFASDKKELDNCVAYREENIRNSHENKTFSGLNRRSLGLLEYKVLTGGNKNS